MRNKEDVRSHDHEEKKERVFIVEHTVTSTLLALDQVLSRPGSDLEPGVETFRSLMSSFVRNKENNRGQGHKTKEVRFFIGEHTVTSTLLALDQVLSGHVCSRVPDATYFIESPGCSICELPCRTRSIP